MLEPLRRLRLVCDTAEHGIAFDLTWEGSFPAVEEQPPPHAGGRHAGHHRRSCRFAQLGTWSGTLQVGGRGAGRRPASGGSARGTGRGGSAPWARPSRPGRAADQPNEGFWWLYVPLRFDDFALVVIVQEQPDGYRTLNDAVRVWPDGRCEQLGWPGVDITYRSGTRHPERAALHLRSADGKPLAVDVDTLGFVPLHVGAGYGGDPDWGHGQWRGPGWVEGAVYDLNDPAIAGRTPFGVIDHVARATCDGAEGWGLFEHATIGRHDPSGFTDLGSVAP